MTNRDNYNKIFDNGVAHLKSAELLAVQESYGFAISHIVLGIEELIKYYVVMAKSNNAEYFETETNPHSRNSVFKDHLTKHGLIKEFQQAISEEFAEEHAKYVLDKIMDRPIKPEHVDIANNRFKEVGSFLGIAYREINLSEEEKTDFYKWLGEANNLKNNGFYVNFNNGICKSPKEIDKEQYDRASKYAEVIKNQIEVQKHLDITDDEFIDLLNSGFQKEF
jgi:AbiV family abortive infection protein